MLRIGEQCGDDQFADEPNQGWPQVSNLTPLAEGDIDIWSLDIASDPAIVNDLSRILTDDEMARAGKFVFPKDRDQFIICRGGLRIILGEYLGCAPEAIRFTYNRFGKPSLDTDESRLRFNISHSRGIAVIAVCFDREIGVDIEFVDHGFDIFGVAAAAFSATDVAQMRSLSGNEQYDAFFAAWTRKEALLKAMGDGLSTDVEIQKTMSFVADASHPVRSTVNGKDTNWYLRSLELQSDLKAAVAVEGIVGTIRFWDLPGGNPRAIHAMGVQTYTVCAE
ncbi:MAG: 4'-phosphopantetheinyl transferase superfamily protein [Pyrinomonadaceae bacterium]